MNHERLLEEQIASDELVDSIDKMVEELEAVGGRHCSSPVQGLPLTGIRNDTLVNGLLFYISEKTGVSSFLTFLPKKEEDETKHPHSFLCLQSEKERGVGGGVEQADRQTD